MKIIKTNEVKNHHIFALIVGSSGIGKTSLVKTLPHDETIIISLESGLLSVKDASIDAVEINSYEELVKTISYIKDNCADKYKHIYIDSLTELSESLFSELSIKYPEKKDSFALYDEYKKKLVSLLKALRGLTQFNIWLTCLDKLEQKDFSNTISMDMHQKSLSKSIPKLFDEVFYMTTIEHDGEMKRIIATDNTVIDFAKDRSSKLTKYELPNLGNIYNKIFNS